MSHGTLDYQSPHSEPHGWRGGDTLFLGAVLAYAALNVVLMLMYAKNMLGPVALRNLRIKALDLK